MIWNRWTPKRKAALVHNIENDLIPFETALKLYDLSREELCAWMDGKFTVTKRKLDA